MIRCVEVRMKMANKNLFKSIGGVVPVATVVNEAGGTAFNLSNEAALAQLACTGTFSGTYYSSAEESLKDVIHLAKTVNPEFLAKLAVYSRTQGFMKDSPALLLAILMDRDINLFKKIFNQVIDNGKMLRNFMQIVRSGQTERRSFGSVARKMIQNWLENRSDKQLFEDSIGNDPSIKDIIKMAHPKPKDKNREALYGYLIGKDVERNLLPEFISEFESFKTTEKGTRKIPNVPFQMLTALSLSDAEWVEIAKNMKWHATRMNLNTMERHNIFSNPDMVRMIADRLSSEKDIKAVNVFPYQLFAAYNAVGGTIPTQIKNALQDAMEVATTNVPKIKGKVFVGVDYSGSMQCPVTGNRGTASTKITCNMVASLMAACVLRNSDDPTIYRFDTLASKLDLNARDSVMTNTMKIGANGGGTDCGAMLHVLNEQKEKGDVVFVISDNESWANHYAYNSTNLMKEWTVFKRRNPSAKLICVDLAANVTSQAPSRKDILNIGGWTDAAFEVISAFLESGSPEYWVAKINETVI